MVENCLQASRHSIQIRNCEETVNWDGTPNVCEWKEDEGS